MRFHRRPKRWLSGWLCLVLLSVQLATSAYACPGLTAAAQTPVAMAGMPGCDGNMPGTIDPEQPQMCKAHCQQGSQTVHPTPASDAPASPMLIAVLDWKRTDALAAQPAGRTSTATPGGSPPGSPPLYLSLLVLRN